MSVIKKDKMLKKNKKLKIAVITGWTHNKIGGVENYCAICYENWGEKYEITEFPLLETGLGNFQVRSKNEKITIDYSLLGKKPYSIMWMGTYKQTVMKKIYQTFDIVILNTSFPPRKWITHPKSVLVQHMHNKWYALGGKDWKVSMGQFFSTLFFGVGTFTNALKNAKNVVFFVPETYEQTKANNIFYIPLTSHLSHEIKTYPVIRNNFSFIGRLENQQKNITALIKLANWNREINIYGHGNMIKKLNNKLQDKSQYRGPAKKAQINEILQTTKALLITSHYEGFPTIAVEALSNGVPIIMFDTFNSVKFFEKSGAVFIIEKNNLLEFNQKINWLKNLPPQEYQKITQNALTFAKTYLSKEMFWSNWDKVLQTFY